MLSSLFSQYFESVSWNYNVTRKGKHSKLWNIWDILSNLKTKLTQRIADKIGFLTSNILKQLPISEQTSIKNQLIMWYKHVLKYIEERFDFSKDSILSKMQIFSLKSMFSFNELCEELTKLSLDNIYNKHWWTLWRILSSKRGLEYYDFRKRNSENQANVLVWKMAQAF